MAKVSDDELEDKIYAQIMLLAPFYIKNGTAEISSGCYKCLDKLTTIYLTIGNRISHKDFIVRNGKTICCECLNK